jgi:peptidoglycan/LPS O-acetylase OafA/YrhL
MSTELPQTATVRVSAPASTYLDALRAVAANLVVVAHVLLLYFPNHYRYRGGSTAVVIFFLLSGFLISRSMLNASTRPGLQLPGFLADRVARIMTPFVPVLVLVALLNVFVIESRLGGAGLNSGVAAFVGNLLMLHDYPHFQLLELMHVDMWWRIRPYNTAEPFWTVAVEFWLYVAVGLFFFCVLLGERIRRSYLWILTALSAPVLLWNTVAGGGGSLSLGWMVGALAAYLIARIEVAGTGVRWRILPWCLIGCGAVALAARAVTAGFDAYDLHTAVLMAIIIFGVLIALNRIDGVARWVAAPTSFFASYSYSLYLTHNTVLVVVFEQTQSLSKPVSIVIGVVLAQLAAWLVYLAFERHYRAVARWLRPMFLRLMTTRKDSAVRRQTSHTSALNPLPFPTEPEARGPLGHAGPTR